MKFTFLFLLGAARCEEGEEKPNIVFVMLDDMGWSNVGFHNPVVKSTPFLDEMTKSEHVMELTNVYTTHRCSPSRAAFLTGVYPYKYGLGSSALKVLQLPLGLDTNMTLLPEVMKREGSYSTHMIGKWHLGHAAEAELPQNRGFDTFYGFYEAQVDYFTHQEQGRHVYRNGSDPVDVSGRYMTKDLTRQTKETLLANHDDPKFIYLPYQSPHFPVSAPEEEKMKLKKIYEQHGIPTNDKMLTFHGAMHVIDKGMKQLWNAALELDRETIFVFTTDNGAGGAQGGCNFPYRGGKDRFLEGGIKATTLIMSTKRKFEKRQNHEMIHVLDWFPTLLGLAGIEAQKTNNGFDIDGVDFSSRFGSSRAVSEPRDRFIVGVKHDFADNKKWKMLYCARYKQYKYCNYHNSMTAWRCDIFPGNNFIPKVSENEHTTANYRSLVHVRSTSRSYGNVLNKSKQMFFDLEKDPFEIYNLWGNPDYTEAMSEVRAWAEGQIGRPRLPIVGASNMAYRNLVHHAGRELYGAPHLRDIQFIGKYFLHTGRVKKTKMCHVYTGQCEVKEFSVSGWDQSAVKFDWEIVTDYWNKYKNSHGAHRSKIENIRQWTLQCGEYCCAWRKERGMPCYFEYSSNPFSL